MESKVESNLKAFFASVDTEHVDEIAVIGDVHGCYEELRQLLQMCRKQTGCSREKLLFICVGDIVAKGPSSIESIQTCIDENILCVLGNHDVEVLRCRTALEEHGQCPPLLLSSREKRKRMEDLLQSARLPFKEGDVQLAALPSEHVALAQSLPEEHLLWLASLPLLLRLPRENALIVHAGLVRGVEPELQSAATLTRLRTLFVASPSSSSSYTHPSPSVTSPSSSIAIPSKWTAEELQCLFRRKSTRKADEMERERRQKGRGETKEKKGVVREKEETVEMEEDEEDQVVEEELVVCSEARSDSAVAATEGKHWAYDWSLDADAATVYYGHDAGRGLEVTTKTIGLDGGCVYGRSLAAALIRKGHVLLNVRARRQYEVPKFKLPDSFNKT